MSQVSQWLNEIAFRTTHLTTYLSVATTGRGIHMLKASSKRKRTAQEMTDFKEKEQLEMDEMKDNEVKIQEQMKSIADLEKKINELS